MATLIETTNSESALRSLWLVFPTPAERVEAMQALVFGGGWNYFVCYRDVAGFALNVGYADWVAPNAVYVDW